MSINSHDFGLADLRKEQENIDGILDHLLKYKPMPKKVGRPQKTPGSPSVNSPTTVGHAVSKATRTDDSSTQFDAITDCVIKINDLNKKLLDVVAVLSERISSFDVKVVEIKETVDSLQCNVGLPTGTVSNEPRDSASTQSTSTLPTHGVLDAVLKKVDRIEQHNNANYLLCRGPSVGSIITANTAAGVHNYVDIKKCLSAAICNRGADVDLGEVTLNIYGKDKNMLKIECPNQAVKISLLKTARNSKPTGLFLSELLTPIRSKLFYQLRSLKKKFPAKFKSVYTRSGGVYYKLPGSERYYSVECEADLPDFVENSSVASA